MALALAACGAGSLANAAGAETCPNEAIRLQESYAAALPDCRAYEQVSPVSKNDVDTLGVYGDTLVSPSGEAVTYTSLAPFPVSEGSETVVYEYMSTRSPDGWSTRGLDPKTDPASEPPSLSGVTPDLSNTIIASTSQPPLTPEANEGESDLYLLNNRTGSYSLFLRNTTYTKFVPIEAAEEDKRIFYEATTPPLETSGVYEWHEGRSTPLDVLPNGEIPSGGGAAGWLGQFGSKSTIKVFYTQGAISQSGARVYFTDLGTERLYLREPQAEPPRTVEVSHGPAQWRAATPDGSRAYYTEKGALWRFEAHGERREALTNEAANVQGVLGIGGEGEYVYFAATAALTSGASPGASNIYLWQDGTISLVTTEGESENWTPGEERVAGNLLPTFTAAEGARTAQVSEDGQALMFVSRGDVTGYDNVGPECITNAAGGGSGHERMTGACDEVYIYSASSHTVVCVSCNPSGAPARSGAVLFIGNLEDLLLGEQNLAPSELPTNLAPDGDSAFFDSEEPLISQDVNKQMNVYEWEREGTGSCSAGRGGCLFLISTGEGSTPSYFAGAGGPSGNNVLFFTRQSLVGQDTDDNVDVYDARIDGGLAAQNPLAPVAPCLGEACRAAQAPEPAPGPPASQVFSGPGNLLSTAEAAPVGKTKMSKAVKMVKRKAKKKKQKARKKNPHITKRGRRK